MDTDLRNAAKLTIPGEREIHVERLFHAPREKVWRAQTDPALIPQWWGRGNPVEIVRNEVAPEGEWRFVEHAPDGDFGFHGHFIEVDPPKHVVLTFEWDGMPGHAVVNTIRLRDVDDGNTLLDSTMRFDTREERDAMLRSGMEQGMNQSYAALDALLARTA